MIGISATGEVDPCLLHLPHQRLAVRPAANEIDGINVLKVILGAYVSDTEKRTVTL